MSQQKQLQKNTTALAMIANRKRRLGDRKDGFWLRELDSMHKFAPYILRNRADSEAFIEEIIDLTAVNEFLDKKNAENPEMKYSLFQVISTALLKTVVLRPALNRFVAGRRVYQRNYLSLAFVAKNKFSDNGGESLLMLRFDEDFTLETVREKIDRSVNRCRGGKVDNSTGFLNKLVKLPRFVLRIIEGALFALDYFGWVPEALIKEEPNYSTLFLSNLGSIKLNAVYHHLNNWGTNSLFAVIGKKLMQPCYQADGSMEMRESLKLGITLDERIADGYYYSRSIALLKYLIAHPEELELPANTPVDYESFCR